MNSGAELRKQKDPTYQKLYDPLWAQIGSLQFDFLKDNGLEPHHRFLDYGCGPGRGADYFVDFLNPGNYLGLDFNQRALDAAKEGPARLAAKKPRFIHVDELAEPPGIYDFAIAQSVFTHCSPAQIVVIMGNIDRLLSEQGVFFATFFEGAADQDTIRQDPGGVVTHHDRNCYHYPREFWREQPWASKWLITCIGDWNHPRNQKMLRIERQS